MGEERVTVSVCQSWSRLAAVVWYRVTQHSEDGLVAASAALGRSCALILLDKLHELSPFAIAKVRADAARPMLTGRVRDRKSVHIS